MRTHVFSVIVDLSSIFKILGTNINKRILLYNETNIVDSLHKIKLCKHSNRNEYKKLHNC